MTESYIIGMSPGNSYFKNDEIRFLIKTLVRQYGQVVVLIADIPAISTYVALGYQENIARREKALPQGNNLKNKVRRIASELGYLNEVRIIDWENEVEKNPLYQDYYSKMKDFYKHNEEFQKSANETTRMVLLNTKKKLHDMESAVAVAVEYLLAEFAFLEFASNYLDTYKVNYIYHKNWKIYEDYISGIFDGKTKSNLDFLLLENPYETYSEMWSEEVNPELHIFQNNVFRTNILRAAFCNYPPACIYNKKSNIFSGIFYDIIKQIAEKNKWQLQMIEETGYGVVTEGLSSDRFDIYVTATWLTPERAVYTDFSKPTYHSLVYMWKRAGSEVNLDSTDTRIAIKPGDITDSIMKMDFPEYRSVRIPQLADTDQLLHIVSVGRADVTFVDEYTAKLFNDKSKIKIVKAFDTPVRVYGNHFIMKKGNDELRSIINSEIINMKKSGEMLDFIKKYTNEKDAFILF